jgi:hypothetical protein
VASAAERSLEVTRLRTMLVRPCSGYAPLVCLFERLLRMTQGHRRLSQVYNLTILMRVRASGSVGGAAEGLER